MNTRSRAAGIVLAIVIAASAIALIVGLQIVPDRPAENSSRPLTAGTTVEPPAPGTTEEPTLGDALLEDFLELAELIPARGNEAILTFKTRQALAAFLDRAEAAGLQIIATSEALSAARVRAGSLSDLRNGLNQHADDYADLAPNAFMTLPVPPPIDERAAINLVPLGNGLLDFLGATGDTNTWGRGTTLAVIDSAISSGDPTFGNGRIQILDLGIDGIAAGNLPENNGHGTAVAALVAGESQDARGVAPGANLLIVPVLDSDGLSDTFTVSQGIVAAVDAGAQIINLSLGSDYNSSTLQRAVDYAIDREVLIVAAAGNSQSTQLAWPAADPRVVSVGAVDATQQQVTYSNSGPQLKIAAPGYGVQTAWTGEDRVLFSGTSASAPIISGSIAAIMSEQPGTTAQQAWQVIQTHSADSGAPGPDPDFGYGVIDLGWAMAHDDHLRVDTAVSSHYYDATTGEMRIVVQNRSNRTISGLSLQVDAAGSLSTHVLPAIESGEISVVSVPVDANSIAGSPHQFASVLINPPGIDDAIPDNNIRSTTLQAELPDDG